MQSSENIYENVLIHTLEPNRTGPALSGNKHMQTSLLVYYIFFHTGTHKQNTLYFQKQLVKRSTKTKMTCVRNNNVEKESNSKGQRLSIKGFN